MSAVIPCCIKFPGHSVCYIRSIPGFTTTYQSPPPLLFFFFNGCHFIGSPYWTTSCPKKQLTRIGKLPIWCHKHYKYKRQCWRYEEKNYMLKATAGSVADEVTTGTIRLKRHQITQWRMHWEYFTNFPLNSWAVHQVNWLMGLILLTKSTRNLAMCSPVPAGLGFSLTIPHFPLFVCYTKEFKISIWSVDSSFVPLTTRSCSFILISVGRFDSGL